MIKKTIIVSLGIIIATIISLLIPVHAATVREYTKVFKEATTICSIYKHTCTVTVVQHDKMFAQTRYMGDIQVSSKLLEVMNERQIRGVLYHEVGHVVFEHIEKTAQYLYESKTRGDYDENYYQEFRRQNEYQADRFATYLIKFTKQKEGLSEALLILTPPEELNKVHKSHPSTNDRIKQIEQILGR